MSALTPWPLPSLYDRLVAAGAEVANHESDLYVRASVEADAVIRQYRIECVNLGLPQLECRAYVSQVTGGRCWFEFPFMFEPFWRRKRGLRRQP